MSIATGHSFLISLHLRLMEVIGLVTLVSGCNSGARDASPKALDSSRGLALQWTTAPSDQSCDCDTALTDKLINQPDFNSITRYDASTFPADSLYFLSAEENRRLWYRDVENPDSTKFTKYWDDYHPTNYRANNQDFVSYYKPRPDIEIAFQLGPNHDLWAYHIFVVKRIDCCYLITRSYFRHARFNYKAYAILNHTQLDRLYDLIDPLKKFPTDSIPHGYSGYFADSRNPSTFFIEFEASVLDSVADEQLNSFFDFIDRGIRWKVSYDPWG